MNYIIENGDFYIRKGDLPEGVGNFFIEDVGNSRYVGSKPLSCFSHSVKNGVISFRDSLACNTCSNYVPCFLLEQITEGSFELGDAEEVFDNPFDKGKFVEINTKVCEGCDPTTFIW